MQLDDLIIAFGGALTNMFFTFIGLLTSHKNFQQILNSEMILILFYGFSDPLYTKFYFYISSFSFILSPQIQ